ncbi:MAG: DnaJ domain-containing protein [Candidatus Moeniiplasma glomeromycotorum]|nr:DnaJ domain-containing protein [Candidatus Moeniiplasma glomeromycotorum]
MTKKKINCRYELLCLLEEKEKKAVAYGYYTTLGLKKENNPSAEEIRKAYHQEALKWHPDKIQQRQGREPDKDEKNKWHEIETAYQILSNPEKRQKYDSYEGKNKYEKMLADIESIMGKENIKVEEKNWKPAEKIKKLDKGSYVLVYFNSERKKAEELKKNVLQSVPKEVLNRYKLLNLTDEISKIKLIKKNKDVKQN